MTYYDHAGFLTCAVLATVMQSITGFALGLILIGLVELFGLAPLSDVSIAVSILTCINAVFYLRKDKPRIPKRLSAPMIIASSIGVLAGVWTLALLAKTDMRWIKLILGVVIIASSFLLLFPPKKQDRFSPAWKFWITGGATGILSGMFATGGPPAVHLLYRQPVTFEKIRNTLLLIFAANALLRIVVLFTSNGISLNSIYLSLECIPVVLILSYFLSRKPITLPPRATRFTVFSLLLVAGLGLAIHSVN